jgi:hypothetical protein
MTQVYVCDKANCAQNDESMSNMEERRDVRA